jgi:hypothetical protein
MMYREHDNQLRATPCSAQRQCYSWGICTKYKTSSKHRYRNLVVSSLFVHDLIGSVDFYSMHQPQRTQCFHIGILLTEFAVKLLSSEEVGSATAFSCSRYEMTLLNWWIFSSFFSSTALALALCVAWRIMIR